MYLSRFRVGGKMAAITAKICDGGRRQLAAQKRPPIYTSGGRVARKKWRAFAPGPQALSRTLPAPRPAPLIRAPVRPCVLRTVAFFESFGGRFLIDGCVDSIGFFFNLCVFEF